MKTTVITGCDSGIGEHLARIFADRGFKVVISYLERNPFAGRDDITAMKMDLRSERDIEGFARLVNERTGDGDTLNYFINNAGVALGGPFEDMPLDIYRAVFEVNFFGLLSVTRKVIPALIRHGGRLVVIGSMAGRIALPYLSPYAASKFALEGWCDSVRRELRPQGVATILIEPAAVATPIWNRALGQDASFVQEKYGPSLQKFQEEFIMKGNEGVDVARAAEMIFRRITKKRPAPRYVIAKNTLAARLQLLIPGRLLDAATAKLFAMKFNGPR
ncbi:MAG: SDR family NAD(P)-dependent oxidoreductase [Chrysiogenales bacterium]|nr:MAG: SDR family NAD(P)-dependent oxidoreductase [Chrysiogenales bacterium]